MQGGGHGPVAHLGIAVRDGDGMFLVQADQHAGRLVAEMVHQAVVQTPVAGAGDEGDIFDFEPPEHLGDRIACPAERLGVGRDRAFPFRVGHFIVCHDTLVVAGGRRGSGARSDAQQFGRGQNAVNLLDPHLGDLDVVAGRVELGQHDLSAGAP